MLRLAAAGGFDPAGRQGDPQGASTRGSQLPFMVQDVRRIWDRLHKLAGFDLDRLSHFWLPCSWLLVEGFVLVCPVVFCAFCNNDSSFACRLQPPRLRVHAQITNLLSVRSLPCACSQISIGSERSNPTIDQLRRRLTYSTQVTRMCGKTVTVSADQPGLFRKQLEKFMDSTNDVSSGQFWPLVKRVRMKGRG